MAYEAGNYVQAHDIWLPLANAGDAEAAFRLGLLADLGKGRPEDPAAAYRWYRRAAEAGHAEAEFNTAVMEDSGRGTRHDASEAAEWYARAAARGNHRAQYNLALLYNEGEGVPRNRLAALAWFRLAAAGLPAAAAKLQAPDPDPPLPGDLEQDRQLHPAVLVAPHAGSVAAPGDDGLVEFAWTAPAEPSPVRYFLQVMARDDSSRREIYAAYLDVTATLVRLDRTRHAYAWRVYTVAPRSASYTVSRWSLFTTSGASVAKAEIAPRTAGVPQAGASPPKE